MSLSISYILMVIAGLYLALSSFDGSLATAALLMVDTGLALIAFITVTFHLARPRNSWPSRWENTLNSIYGRAIESLCALPVADPGSSLPFHFCRTVGSASRVA